jgi:hypothetical protein
MKTKIRVPRFKSESQEAKWWDAHRGFVADKVMKAMEDGTALRGVAKKLARSRPGAHHYQWLQT